MKRILGKRSGALCLAVVMATQSVQAAVDMFLDLGPGLAGESTDRVHKDQVDVLAWSWGMANSGTTHLGGGAGAGRVNIQDLSFTKYVDKATPELMLRCANGAHIPKVILFVRKAGSNPIEYIKITLTEVLVSSVSTGGSAGEDRLTENVTLNFAKVLLEYVPTKPDGTAGDAKSFSWDIQANMTP
jgi:type VI secretion system secreted protein Hcp